MNGMTVVPAGKFMKIRKIDDAKSDSIEMYSGAYYPTGDQLITRLIRLKYISAEEITKTFDKIIKSKAGQMAAYEKTNSLIITDLGSNVDRISRILEEMDKPGFEEKLEVIQIKNAKSKDMAELITKIINKGEDKTKNTFRPASRFGQSEKAESIIMVSGDDRTNSIIVLANSEGIARIHKLVAQLDYPLDMTDAGGVRVYYVKHGEAKKIADTLNGIAQETEKKAAAPVTDPNNPAAFKPPTQKLQLFGGDVIIKADESTNALIITGSKQDYATVLAILEKLDLPKDQVYVETYIVEMDASKLDNWSFNILKFGGATNDSATTDNGVGRAGYILGSPTTLTNLTSEGGVFGFGSNDKVLVNLGGSQVRVPSLLSFIELLKTQISANVLSKPQIMAMDNEEAFIEVGDEIPVGLAQNIANNGQTSQLPQFKDAVISMKLKPFISPDSDIVTLNVEQKANDISSKPIKATALAAVSQGLKKRTIRTNLTLKSGDTAVLGGLIQDSDTYTEKKIPLLGDIPVLGWLFKSRNVQRTKNNLMVFLTPKIIRNSQDHKKLTHSKITDRIDWIKRNAGGRDPFGKEMEGLAKYAEAPDEFQLEDQSVSPGAKPIDSQPTGGENNTEEL